MTSEQEQNGSVITLQIGPAANNVMVHYWNALSVIKPNTRTQTVYPGYPNTIIVDKALDLHSIIKANDPIRDDHFDSILSSLPTGHWLRDNSVPIELRHYHPVKETFYWEPFENSVRVFAEKSDYLDAFQVVSEAGGLFGEIFGNQIQVHLEDMYPKKTRLVLPIINNPKNSVDWAIFLHLSKDSAVMPLKMNIESTLLASAIDTLNVAGFQWAQNGCVYSSALDNVSLFVDNLNAKPSFTVYRGQSSTITCQKNTFFESQRPYLMVKNKDKRWEFTQPESSKTKIYANPKSIADFIKETCQGRSEFSRFAFASHDYTLYDEVKESLASLIERCCT